MSWKVVATSVPGFYRSKDDSPSQDAFDYNADIDGYFIAVLADGAGSAQCSRVGAIQLCSSLVPALAVYVQSQHWDIDPATDVEALRRAVEAGIAMVRNALLIKGNSAQNSLYHYHATVIGVVAGPSGGTFFHIGDGAACATTADDMSTGIVSPPENGEYANETYFYTEANWKHHLRLTTFDKRYDVILLMSDGVSPLAIAGDNSRPYAPFVGPISNYLFSNTVEDSEKALSATLQRPEVRVVTDDDKTLIWAARI